MIHFHGFRKFNLQSHQCRILETSERNGIVKQQLMDVSIMRKKFCILTLF